MQKPTAFNYRATISSATWLFRLNEFSDELVDGVYAFSMLKSLPFMHRKNFMLILQVAANVNASAVKYLFMYLGAKVDKVRNYAINLILQYMTRAG